MIRNQPRLGEAWVTEITFLLTRMQVLVADDFVKRATIPAELRAEGAIMVMGRKKEQHKIGNLGWLRAAVLGANDGIVSTASIMVGVAAANGSHASILLAGASGLVAGAMSMATGEYVSVHSQADTEAAALAEEKIEIAQDFQSEERELAAIYVKRGLDLSLARSVAKQLMAHDALAAHARDELGIQDLTAARPLLAATSSAISFSIGAALPVGVAAISVSPDLIPAVVGSALVALILLGGLAANAGGAPILAGSRRVAFWSALSMGVTAGVGLAIAHL